MKIRAEAQMRWRDDEGISMILVVGYTAVALLMAATLTALTLTSLRSSTSHGQFERSLSVAEAGIDQQLARLQQAYNAAPGSGDAPVPGPGNPCGSGTEVNVGSTHFASNEEERDWARAQLEALATDADCVSQSSDGEYVVFKPGDRNIVYALSAVPSFTAAEPTQRLLKSEFLFTPYSPSHAVLTSADLCFSGSVDVLDPNASADIHTNGDIDCASSGNPAVYVEGTVSSSGAIEDGNFQPNPTVEGSPNVGIPLVDADSVYNAEARKSQYAGQWFDLCPDGTVKSPASSGAPCTGTVLADLSGAGTYQGWDYEGTLSGGLAGDWHMRDGSSGYPGVYYVHEGSARVDPGHTPHSAAWNATVIASARSTGSTACDKVGGDIYFDSLTIDNKMTGVVLYAEGDIDGHQRVDAASGLFVAGDQITLDTSSSSLQGALVAADQCPASDPSDVNSIQGVTITFDGSIEAPLTSMIRTSLWLEYVG